MMQYQVSLRMLSLFVIAAINVELNTSLIALYSIVSDVVFVFFARAQVSSERERAFSRIFWGSILC